MFLEKFIEKDERTESADKVKKILYIDMDGVLVDFESGINRCSAATLEEYKGRYDEIPGIFGLMDPMPGAIESFNTLFDLFDVYLLSTAPWENSSAWSDKLIWVKKWLMPNVQKRLILSHNKHLCAGFAIIDDRTANGVDKFTGLHVHFGTEKWPDWPTTVEFLKEMIED